MSHGHTCCGGWTPKQGTIMIGIFTIVACFLWISWEAYNMVWIDRAIDQSKSVCSPNPCENRGLCIASGLQQNTLGYVCDCAGTGYLGYHCNTTQTRVGVKRTCGDYFREGYRKNGTYMMDFDGHTSSVRDSERVPFVTRCNFTDNRAYTIINHDNLFRTLEGDENTDDATYERFNRTFYYEVDRSIMEDLKEKDKMVCYQSFTFECKNAKLNLRDEDSDDKDVNNASFLQYGSYTNPTNVDLTGTEIETDHDPEPRCPCADEGTCAASNPSDPFSNKCNCDKGDNTWRTDSTTFSTLNEELGERIPILGMSIVDEEDSDERFYYTLSPFICYEDFDTLKIAPEDRLILTDHTRSGLRVIWGIMIAMMVITVLLLLCAILMLIAVTYEACHALLPWLVMILIFNIMLFIAVVIRWFYLGYLFVAIEVAISAMWIILTIYSMVVVGMHYSDCLNTRVMHM